jgi:hypothetical protein
MKTLMQCVWVLMLCASWASLDAQARMIEKTNLDFSSEVREIGNGDVLYFYYLSEKNSPSELRRKDPIYARMAKALGKIDRSQDKVYALILKTVHAVFQPMNFYVRSELLNSLDYLRLSLDTKDIRRLSDTIFEVPPRGTVPGFRMDRELLSSREEVERKYGADLSLLTLRSLDSDLPFLVQNLDQFTKVLGLDSSKDARLISAHYDLGSGFMVESYTLSHLYNVPPRLVGGTKRLKDDFLKSVEAGIQRAQSYRP